MIFQPDSDERLHPGGDASQRWKRRGRFRRGVYLLPSMFTLANMFCGYACVVYAMRGDYETAAPLIGLAFILDALDGRIARLTKTASPFGVEFDSLADVISFGIAPAVLTFSWGMSPLGRLGWAASFLFVTGAALRLARFNIQGAADKRYFAGMPAPAAAAVLASTVYAYPTRLESYPSALPVLALVLVPAFLMVSTIRFRSFKDLDLTRPRSYTVLILLAAGLVAITSHPRWVLVVLAYGYLVSAFVEWAMARARRRGAVAPPLLSAPAGDSQDTQPPRSQE
jgi:CDP-diacylglycerol--serine O-phosphatidyltransferase